MKRKAGPPKEPRKKTAHVTLRKDSMLMQAESRPRTAWGAKSRKIKKM